MTPLIKPVSKSLLTALVLVALLISVISLPATATESATIQYNPYAGVSGYSVYEGELHVHTTNSDGAFTPSYPPECAGMTRPVVVDMFCRQQWNRDVDCPIKPALGTRELRRRA